MNTWCEPIFAGFDLSNPNPARWELPARIEELHRMGRGYSFDVLRAKVLFTPELNKLGTVDGSVVNFGVDISSFTEAVQNGNQRWSPSLGQVGGGVKVDRLHGYAARARVGPA